MTEAKTDRIKRQNKHVHSTPLPLLDNIAKP